MAARVWHSRMPQRVTVVDCNGYTSLLSVLRTVSGPVLGWSKAGPDSAYYELERGSAYKYPKPLGQAWLNLLL